MNNFKIIGAAIGNCGKILGCELAPDTVLKSNSHLKENWIETIYSDSKKTQLDSIEDLTIFSEKLALSVKKVADNGDIFCVIGGDHSSAIGTWSGAEKSHGEIGLIWIDAHMDAHTPESSHSGNLHGMPVATLLGYGDKNLISILSKEPKIKPENIVLMGVRCYEKEEYNLLNSLNIKIYFISDIKEKGFKACFNEAIEYLNKKSLPIGITLDLDGLDPQDIAAVGTPEKNGIRLKDLLNSLPLIKNKNFIGIEITEYNPTLDSENYKDAMAINTIINCLYDAV